MNRLALTLPVLCLGLVAPQVMARPVLQPTTEQAQAVLDRLVQEPLRYEGESMVAPDFRQASGYTGRQPTHVLMGYRVEGARLSGEFVVLDADNRPLQAAPLTGQIAQQGSENVGYRVAGHPAGPMPCTIDIVLPKPLHLDGQCAPAMISGAYAERVKASPLMFIIPGLGASETTSGQYMMKPWRG